MRALIRYRTWGIVGLILIIAAAAIAYDVWPLGHFSAYFWVDSVPVEPSLTILLGLGLIGLRALFSRLMK